MLRRRLGETELAPALATLLEVLRQHDLHQDLIDSMVEAVRDYVAGHSRQIADLVEERSEWRSEEHTSELQSLMRNTYAVFCLKKKKHNRQQQPTYST